MIKQTNFVSFKTGTLIILFLAIVQYATAQKYISKTGHIWFFSHTPVEDIEAHNHQVASTLNVSNGEIAFGMLIKGFEFKKALMQEHFNENYMESDKIPKANFKGKITNLSNIDFKKDGTYATEVSGDLTIHGVTKPITTKGTIDVKDGKVTAKAKFIVSPKDYDIKIPSVVEKNIAREIEVNIDTSYSPT
jgi:YceI-like domain